jgi:phage replication-related protein YjqB (UPF0714/DUF867 family)
VPIRHLPRLIHDPEAQRFMSQAQVAVAIGRNKAQTARILAKHWWWISMGTNKVDAKGVTHFDVRAVELLKAMLNQEHDITETDWLAQWAGGKHDD